ncbi:hypothetical protein [Pedobacter frigoris]|uniref:Uncharacterized protein n=1 Tax=Pedobacter frigoris TaxID=2571272 RepID=A0A4V5P013_9SPHI|nr:hypothetical protein [Pedobacter frigoris]TKC09122.1 hypothetical protein FA047_03235 [Pedobacter frigoris]
MQEFDHIQSLWQSHSVEVKISSDEMLAQAKKEVNGIRTRSLFNILGMVLSFAAITGLIIFFQFNSWTTLAGLSIIVASVAVYTLILYKDYRIIAQNDFTEHPNAFLSRLKIYQLNKFTIYNKLYWFYAIALSIGFILYFYEMLDNLNIWAQVGIIAFTIFWMTLCATILRKAYMKREKERLDLLIEKFERISDQFKEQQ